MPLLYRKIALAGAFVLLIAIAFALATVNFFRPEVPHAGLLLRNMTSSYSFVDDVYFLHMPSLKKRLKDFTDQLQQMTGQPTCLSARFSNFKEGSEVNLSVCSGDAKISDLAKNAGNSGVVDVHLGKKQVGEIEWITQEKTNYRLIVEIFLCYLTALTGLILLVWFWFIPHQHSRSSDKDEGTNASELMRSLYRVMSNNRRIMGLNDNWVCCESATHPNIMLYTLEGSKVRLRASLKDINKIFPHACFVNRRTLLNPTVMAHTIQGNKLLLESKNFKREIEIDPAYLEGLES